MSRKAVQPGPLTLANAATDLRPSKHAHDREVHSRSGYNVHRSDPPQAAIRRSVSFERP